MEARKLHLIMSTKSKNIFLGKNIAPYPIEDRIKSELADFVSNCVVVSDTNTFTSILLVGKMLMLTEMC